MSISRPDQYQRSRSLYGESSKYLAGGVSSNFRLGARPVPLFFERACGSRLCSVDGQVYVDYTLGMGPVILGHAPPKVVQAVRDCLTTGQLFAGQHEPELRLARLISSLVPCAERVRFSCSGSEAIQAALRLARAFTGKRKIVKFEGHYHGWFDNIFVGVRPAHTDSDSGAAHMESRGQDPLAASEVILLPWNDSHTLERTLRSQASDIAAVIMEPILCNTCVIPPRPGYLEKVRELCSDFGVVLIFDEVITGFRVHLSGAQGLLGVTPDLAVFAKAMGSGFPISCLAGRAGLMDLIGRGEVMHGGTYNTNLVSVVAALATIEELQAHNSEAYRHMYRLGERLMEGLRAAGRECRVDLLVQGLGPVFHTAFTDMTEIADYWSYRKTDQSRLAAFIDALLLQGVRVTSRGAWFLSTAHSEKDIDETIDASARALAEVAVDMPDAV